MGQNLLILLHRLVGGQEEGDVLLERGQAVLLGKEGQELQGLQAAGRLLHRLGQHRAALAVAEVAPVAVAARIPGVT